MPGGQAEGRRDEGSLMWRQTLKCRLALQPLIRCRFPLATPHAPPARSTLSGGSAGSNPVGATQSKRVPTRGPAGPTNPATVRKSVSLYLVKAERQGIKADRKMLYIGPEPATEHVAATLQVEPGEDVIARRKLMFANGVPVRIATSFFRADLFADTRMAEPDFVRPSLQSAIENLGYTFGRAEESLISRRPTLFERARPSNSSPTSGSSRSSAPATAPKAHQSTPSKPSAPPPGTSSPSARSPAPTSSDLPNRLRLHPRRSPAAASSSRVP
jgi:hypothetical protein